MRVVWSMDEFHAAFDRAVSEARSAFGDPTVFIERFLHRPRHIEVQILGDSSGEVIHLFERDCSTTPSVSPRITSPRPTGGR